MVGIVKWFNNKKGYGFITNENGEDLFVHYTNIVSDNRFKSLSNGSKVSFDVTTYENGPVAVNVREIEV